MKRVKTIEKYSYKNLPFRIVSELLEYYECKLSLFKINQLELKIGDKIIKKLNEKIYHIIYGYFKMDHYRAIFYLFKSLKIDDSGNYRKPIYLTFLIPKKTTSLNRYLLYEKSNIQLFQNNNLECLSWTIFDDINKIELLKRVKFDKLKKFRLQIYYPIELEEFLLLSIFKNMKNLNSFELEGELHNKIHLSILHNLKTLRFNVIPNFAIFPIKINQLFFEENKPILKNLKKLSVKLYGPIELKENYFELLTDLSIYYGTNPEYHQVEYSPSSLYYFFSSQSNIIDKLTKLKIFPFNNLKDLDSFIFTNVKKLHINLIYGCRPWEVKNYFTQNNYIENPNKTFPNLKIFQLQIRNDITQIEYFPIFNNVYKILFKRSTFTTYEDFYLIMKKYKKLTHFYYYFLDFIIQDKDAIPIKKRYRGSRWVEYHNYEYKIKSKKWRFIENFNLYNK